MPDSIGMNVIQENTRGRTPPNDGQRRRYTGYPVVVTTRGTNLQNIRIDRTLWTEAGAAANQQGTDRSAVIRAFLEWYVGRPGARIPERPGGGADDVDRVADVRGAAQAALEGIEAAVRRARELLD